MSRERCGNFFLINNTFHIFFGIHLGAAECIYVWLAIFFATKGIDWVSFVASYIVEVDLMCGNCFCSISFPNAAFPMCSEAMVIILLSLTAVHPGKSFYIYECFVCCKCTLTSYFETKHVKYLHYNDYYFADVQVSRSWTSGDFSMMYYPRWTNGWIVQRGCSFNKEASDYIKQVRSNRL